MERGLLWVGFKKVACETEGSSLREMPHQNQRECLPAIDVCKIMNIYIYIHNLIIYIYTVYTYTYIHTCCAYISPHSSTAGVWVGPNIRIRIKC